MQKENINNFEYIKWNELPQHIQEELDCVMQYNQEQRGSETVTEIVNKLRTITRNPPPDHQIFKVWVFENFEFTSN